MDTDIAPINMPLEALCELTQEALFVLDLTSNEIVAESPTFQNLDSYYMAALKHWGSEEKDYLVHQQDRTLKSQFFTKLASADDDDLRSLRFRILNPRGGLETLEVCFKIVKRDLDLRPVLALGRLKTAVEKSDESGMLEEVFKHAPQALLVWKPLLNQTGEITDFTLYLLNPKAQKLLGLNVEAVSGKKFTDLFPGKYSLVYVKTLAEAFASSLPLDENTFLYQSADMQQFSMRFSCLPDHLLLYIEETADHHQQHPVDAAAGAGLRQEYQALELARNSLNTSLSQRNQELLEKQEDYRCLIEATADVVWELDTLTNESKAIIVSREDRMPEIDLREKLWVDAVHDQDWEQASTLWLKANVEKKQYECRVRIKTKGDGYKYMISRGVPVLNQQEEIRKWIGSLTDIHDQVIAEETMKKALKRAQADKLALLNIEQLTDNFLHEINHDLRLPISNLMLLLDLIETSRTPEEKLQHLDIMHHSVNQLRSLNSGFAEIIAIRSDKHQYSMLQLEVVLKRVMQELLFEIQQKKAKIEVQLDDLPPFCYVECFAFHILKILLSNAIRYAPDEKSPEVSVTGYKEGEYYVLVVSDKGTGIDVEKYQNHLFKPFKRLSNKGEGKGIGLYIVKTLLETNGGAVRLESTPGKGTKVYCLFREYDVERVQEDAFLSPGEE